MAVNKQRRRAVQAVTIEDVALKAGVSRMTASRALNGENHVSPRKQERVRRVAAQLNYRSNSAARALAGREPPRVAFIYSNPSQTYLSELLIGALHAATTFGLRITLGSAASPTERQQEIGSLLESGVRTFVLPSPVCNSVDVLSSLRKTGAIWAAISPSNPELHPVVVSADHFDAARRLTSRIVAVGHRCIGFITGDPASRGAADRFRDYVSVMQEAGLDFSLVEQGYFTFESGQQAAVRLLSKSPACTAIIACNDDMAAAAISVAHHRGLKVPEDLTIAGFDDTPISTIVSPAITTVRQPIAQMAQAAIGMLDEAIRARQRAPNELSMQRQFQCSLIERESSATLRTAADIQRRTYSGG